MWCVWMWGTQGLSQAKEKERKRSSIQGQALRLRSAAKYGNFISILSPTSNFHLSFLVCFKMSLICLVFGSKSLSFFSISLSQKFIVEYFVVLCSMKVLISVSVRLLFVSNCQECNFYVKGPIYWLLFLV